MTDGGPDATSDHSTSRPTGSTAINRRDSAVNENRRQAILALSLVVCAGVFGYLGFHWTRGVGAPNFPQACTGYVDGRCEEEQSGLYIYVSDPSDPIALSDTYSGPQNQNDVLEQIMVGANVPAGQSLRWMVELYGVARLRPWKPDSVHPRKVYLENAELRSFKSRLPDEPGQILSGTIDGPSSTYNGVKANTNDPAGFAGNIGSAAGLPTGEAVTENRKWVLGDLPYVFATPIGTAPGSPALAPNIIGGPLDVPGRWYFPKKAFVAESFAQPDS
jgi:hypothetical protein